MKQEGYIITGQIKEGGSKQENINIPRFKYNFFLQKDWP